MKKRSHKEERPTTGQEVELDLTDDDLIEVYEGHLTHLFSDLQIANPYYSKIKGVLVAQGCIEQLRRGGGSAMSKWILQRPPEEETFKALMERKRPTTGRLAILEQQVKDQRVMLTSLSNKLEELTDYIQQGRQL